VTELESFLDEHIRVIVDWPTAGVHFRDINPLLAHPLGIGNVVDGMNAALLGAALDDFDVVAGIEARGFMLGAALAAARGIGFIPVRKQGKLPGQVHAVTYDLEYGTATLELQIDAVRPGQRVLLVDDVLATGGTAGAASALLTTAGGNVVALMALLEISVLGGRSRLMDLPVLALRAV